MQKLLMFDFDGTLVDTGPDIVAAVNEFLVLLGRPQLPYETVVSFVGKGLADLVQKVAPETRGDWPRIKEIEAQFLEVYDRHVLNQAKPLVDIVEYLESCPHQIAIVSNKREKYIPKILEHLGWNKFPWVAIVGGDTFAEKKPHPLPLQEVMRRTSMSPEDCLMIGDGFPDVEAAAACGVTSIAVDFGYAPIEQLLSRGADHRISRFSELHHLITD